MNGDAMTVDRAGFIEAAALERKRHAFSHFMEMCSCGWEGNLSDHFLHVERESLRVLLAYRPTCETCGGTGELHGDFVLRNGEHVDHRPCDCHGTPSTAQLAFVEQAGYYTPRFERLHSRPLHHNDVALFRLLDQETPT